MTALVPYPLMHSRFTRRARDFYSEMWTDTKNAIVERAVNLMRDPRGKGKIKALVDAEFNTASLKGVYFPLARFGDYVVLGKTSDGVYFREQYASQGEMEKARRQLAREGNEIIGSGKKADFSPRDIAQSSRFVSELYKAMEDDKNMAMNQIDPATKLAFFDEVNQIALEMLPDLSAAKQSIHRKGTKGFSDNARRAFAHHAIHGSNRLSRIKYGYRMEQLLDGMREEAEANNIVSSILDRDKPAAMRVYDEMAKRHQTIMNPDGSPLASYITNAAFLWFLGGSLGAGIVNMTQTPLVAMPQLGAKYGWGKTSAALTSATKGLLCQR